MPRLFHQVWLGENPIPEEYVAYRQSWLRHHPDWELRLWTEETLPDSLRRPEAAERLRVPAERSDILRLEVVWRYGGVYLDTDLECLGPIGELIGEAPFFTAVTGSDTADSYLFGAVARHPILDHALNQIRPQTSYGFKKTKTGPSFLDSVLADQPDEILLLRPRTLKAYTTHHKHRTYLDSETVRLDILKAKLAMLTHGEAARGAPPDGHPR
jgi:mannosyltransferase OCH1-like enzyme